MLVYLTYSRSYTQTITGSLATGDTLLNTKLTSYHTTQNTLDFTDTDYIKYSYPVKR